ncbi:hypothetical protein ACET3Z_021690 [Daucus carota]
MAGRFVIEETNLNGFFDPEASLARFRPWVRFLNSQSLVSTAITASAELQIQTIQDFYSSALNTTLLDNYRMSGEVHGGRTIHINYDVVNRILGFPRENFAELPTEAELTNFFETILYQGEINLPRMLKGNLKPEWDLFFDTLAKVFAPTTRKNFNVITSLLQKIGFSIVYNRPINFGKLILQAIISKLGPLRNRSVEQNAKVACFYPRFIMLFLNDKMTDAEKEHYSNSPVAPVPRACSKLMTQLDNKNKFAAIPLITTPHMLQMFNAPLQPYQLQVAHPPQPQQQQQQQQQQPQEPQPLQIQQPTQHHQQQLLQQQQQQHSPQQSQEAQSSHHSSNQSSYHSPIHQQQSNPSFEDQNLDYDLFEHQPSSSEPLPHQTQSQIIPQTQSTSQPLPSDSPINPELQSFRQDLQVAQVLSNLSSNFNVDTSDYGCDFVCDLDFVLQPTSNEPDNTQVHNLAEDSLQQTLVSPNTLTNTSMQPVRKVARKRSSSSLMNKPTALSPSKKQRVETLETTVASSVPSQQGSDFEMADKQSLDPFSLQDVAIEIDRPAAVTCTESSTALALTLVPAQTDTQAELGSVQVNLPSQASGGQFVPPLPLNPSQGTLVVYTGTAGRVTEKSDVRQTPSDTHAREASETALSVREVSAHTNPALFEEQMAKLRAELARMIAENEKLKGAQLVTLQQKTEERPSSSYRDELKEEIHDLAVEMRSNHELYMSKFETIDSKLDQLLRNSNKSDDQPSGEDPSTKGENRDKV